MIILHEHKDDDHPSVWLHCDGEWDWKAFHSVLGKALKIMRTSDCPVDLLLDISSDTWVNRQPGHNIHALVWSLSMAHQLDRVIVIGTGHSILGFWSLFSSQLDKIQIPFKADLVPTIQEALHKLEVS